MTTLVLIICSVCSFVFGILSIMELRHTKCVRYLSRMKVSKKDVSLLVAHIVNSLQEQINTLSLVSYQIEPQDNSMPKLKMAHLIINGKHWYYYTYDQKDLFAIVVRDTPVTAVPVN